LFPFAIEEKPMLPIPKDAIKLIISETVPKILRQPGTDSLDVVVIINSGPAKGKVLAITVKIGE